ncbi:hypothetical protein BBJ28_00010908 [Nothophytophthora sp. Chile5]|nr:hypothetical protein BBJ28_00010908 [Nothophytophthora sp. Chile5]
MGLPPPAPLERLTSPKPLQGKEVMPEQLAPEHSRSTRFSAVDSFPPNMRKREHGESVVNVEMHEAPHAKRQRVVVTEKQVNSLSDRLANWLMPLTTTSTPAAQTDAPTQGDAPPEEAAGTTSRQFFPFKQRQPTPVAAELSCWIAGLLLLTLIALKRVASVEGACARLIGLHVRRHLRNGAGSAHQRAHEVSRDAARDGELLTQLEAQASDADDSAHYSDNGHEVQQMRVRLGGQQCQAIEHHEPSEHKRKAGEPDSGADLRD